MKNVCYVRAALLLLCAAVVLTGCENPGESETQYIRVSDAACTFKGMDNQPVTIEVYSSPTAWDVEALASWVTIAGETETSFTIQVADNESDEERMAQVIVTAGKAEKTIDIIQVAKDYTFPRYRFMSQFQYGTPMSPTGKWAGGFYSVSEDGELNQYAVIIDLETDEWIEHGPYPMELLGLFQTMCISDNGELFIATERDATVMFDLDGNHVEIEAPAGFTGTPSISQVSADGVWVGWCSKNGTSYPLKWVNGVAEELPRPELNYRGEEIGDVQARGISADGRIIYGTTWDNLDFGMVYWDETGTVRYVGEDVHKLTPVERPDGYGGTYDYNLANGMWTTATNTNVSPNGKWIAGTYREESLSDDGQEVYESNWPAFYNTETHKTVIFTELSGGGGVSATSDGIGFTADSTFGPSSGYVVDIENGVVLGSAVEWIESEYGILIPSGYITYLPDSKDRLLGAALWTGGASLEGVNWYIGPAR